MPIDQSKLDALKSLASGGSQGLDAYRQAQGAEQASRTDALKGALGGQDVYNASMKAQAQYAPSVGTSQFADAGNLAPAANQFLDQGAAKLANEAYEAQQKLTLEAAGIRQAGEAKNRNAMLQGAADIYGQDQQGKLQTGALEQTAARQAILKGELNNIALQTPQGSDSAMVTPEQELANEQRKAEIVAELGSLDKQFGEQAGTYAGMLGRDTKGLEAAYQGGGTQLQDLLSYLQPEAQARGREIETGGAERLRELAPAFGIDPLAAAGMFTDTEGTTSGMKDAQAKAAREQYISGEPTAKESKAARLAQDEDDATSLGFDNPADYNKLRSKTGLTGEDIQGAMQSPHWAKIQEAADATSTGEIENGYEGFKSAVKGYVNGLTDAEGKPMAQKERARLIELASVYFKPTTLAASGKGEAE